MATLNKVFDRAAPVDRRNVARCAHWFLGMLLAVVSTASLAIGPADVSLWSVLGKLNAGLPISNLEKIVLLDIRLPRLCMGICVGAALALSGVVMQGLFRNPLADPGLVGVGAGAGLGAISAIEDAT